jgi:hypothetical protein
MMGSMTRLVLLLSVSSALVFSQDLSKVGSVYVLSMSRGLDQYLANRLTHEHVFKVVTDPKLADAVFTDQIGQGFEEKLAALESNPEPVSRPPADLKKPDQGEETGDAAARISALAQAPPQTSTWARGKGTVFLVDPKSHRVLWSTYQLPKNSTSDELNRTASDIVSRLRRDLKLK